MKARESNVRGVTLEVVVDVDGDAGVSRLVVARKRNLGRVRATSARDVDLSAANILAGVTVPG